MKVSILVDGKRVQVNRGAPLLHAAQKAGVHIPTLCYHEKLKPYGACRLCMVEVSEGGRQRLVTACSFPAEAGMEVRTDAPEVRQLRRMLIRLLMGRCPDASSVQKIAERMGVEHSGLAKTGDSHCILCALCVRVCEEVVGVQAIGLANRGVDREVNTPFAEPSAVCIECGSCSYICPTGCIRMDRNSDTGLRQMQMGKLDRDECPHQHRCEDCEQDRAFMEEAARSIREFRAATSRTSI